MFIRRIVVRNLRSFQHVDLHLRPGVTQIIGENNTGKTNLLHAIRLVLDARLPSGYRTLLEHDIHGSADFSEPIQVIVSVELTDFSDDDNAMALVADALIEEPDVARIHYRFRPRQSVQEELESGTRTGGSLTLSDYHWELTGGGSKDPATVSWDEQLGSAIRSQTFQNYHVTLLPALRDVAQDLRSSRVSLLHRLIESSEITEAEKQDLLNVVSEANSLVEEQNSVSAAGTAVKNALDEVAGEAFTLDVRVGVSEPTLTSILRSLTLLLTDSGMRDFDTARNGLGLNNLLYIGILLELFDRRSLTEGNAGQLLLVEEPEAHLHPHLQRVLHGALSRRDLQTLITTHSTHITSSAGIDSFIVLSKSDSGQIRSVILGGEDSSLSQETKRDLDRYLDATRSELLFARRVMLVEGPSEAFLIPMLAKVVLGRDLDRLGVSVVPIYGTHFKVYAALFSEEGIPRRCAIVADGDLHPSDAADLDEGNDEEPPETQLDALTNPYVAVFRNAHTFERALTLGENLPMLASAARELGAVNSAAALESGHERWAAGGLSTAEKKGLAAEMRDMVLKTARRIGKARFAQVASSFVTPECAVPEYIENALDWLTDEPPDQ